MHSAKVATQIRAQIRRFSGEVSVGLPKTAARLVREEIYAVQSRALVRLSEIARADGVSGPGGGGRAGQESVDAAHEPKGDPIPKEPVAGGRDEPVHQAELSVGRHPSSEIRAVAQSGDPGPTHRTGREANLRRSRVLFLRHCGWDQAAFVRSYHRDWTTSIQSAHEPASLFS